MKNCTAHHNNEKAMNQFFQSPHLTKTRVCIFIGSLNLTLMQNLLLPHVYNKMGL